MDYFIVSGLVAEVLILSRLDKSIFGTWITPFNLLAYPYMVVLVSAFLLGPALGFVAVYTPSILIWMVGLFLFWAMGALLGWGLFGGRPISKPFASTTSPRQHEAATTRLAMVLAWAIMPIMAYSLYESAMSSGGWAEIGSLDFKIAYSHGVGAHAVVLAFPLVIFLMGTYRKGTRLQLLTVCGLLLFLFASQVKGTLLAPFIGAIVFRVARGDLNPSMKKLGVAAGITYLMFNGVYLLGYSFADSSVLTESEVYPELGRHYLYYLWSGVLALSEAIKHGVGRVGGPWYEIFSPFINLYREIFGAGHLVGAGSAHELGMETDLLSTVFQGVNVYTMFGTLYLYLGALGGICVVLVLSMLFYGLLLLCRTTDNVWLFTLYCALVSWLVLGFFEYYFMSLTFIEVAVYCLILRLLSGWNSRVSPPGISVSLNLRSSSMEPL